MVQPSLPMISLEESIRKAYNRVELETIGSCSTETHVLAVDNKIVVVARGIPANSRQLPPARTGGPLLPGKKLYEDALRHEFASELGCEIVSMRTDITLADDEKMEIFLLKQPLQ
jgi:uncharacterized protein YbcI